MPLVLDLPPEVMEQLPDDVYVWVRPVLPEETQRMVDAWWEWARGQA